MNRNKLLLTVISAFIICSCNTNYAGPGVVPGKSYFGANEYIEFIPGNMPLIISVPHGGYTEPSNMQDRDCGWNHSDTKCIEIAKMIKDSIFAITGKYPYIILNNLKRSKLDPNREEFEATCGDSVSLPYYYEYHKFIDSAKAMVMQQFGKGLYIDLHGHNHKVPRIEIGYVLDTPELEIPDSLLNDVSFINKSSVKNLALNSGLKFSELIRGEKSLGAIFESYGYECVPDNKHASPGKEEFFQGGYDVDTHGSGKGGTIDAIQIETQKPGLRDNTQNQEKFSGVFTHSILRYIKMYYYPSSPSPF